MVGNASVERQDKALKAETKLQNKIRAALSEAGCVIFRRNSGLFYTADGRPIIIGVNGEADLSGHRTGDGRAVYIEVKLPGEEPREEQVRFLEAMKATGALVGVAHTVDEAINILRR